MFKRVFVLFSEYELPRLAHIEAIREVFPELEMIKPVFPSYEHVPFLDSLIEKSKERTGKALLATEIGVILSHREI